MTNPPELQELELRAYSGTYADGVIDLFVGGSLVWIGAMWLWLPDYLSGAVALVALLISPVMRRRRHLVESRTGYVVFAESRRRWERRIYTTAGFVFAGFMLIARPLGSLQSDDTDWPVGPDSITTWLLALVAVLLWVMLRRHRLLVYAIALAASGAVPVIVTLRLGWPLLLSGVVIFGTGWVMVRRFVDRHPSAETP